MLPPQQLHSKYQFPDKVSLRHEFPNPTCSTCWGFQLTMYTSEATCKYCSSLCLGETQGLQVLSCRQLVQADPEQHKVTTTPWLGVCWLPSRVFSCWKLESGVKTELNPSCIVGSGHPCWPPNHEANTHPTSLFQASPNSFTWKIRITAHRF